MEKDLGFKYVDESILNKDLLCSICECPYIEPTEHQCVGTGGCSQIYCKVHVKEFELCPHCRNKVIWHPVAITPLSQKFIFNPLNQLKVICKYCDNIYERLEWYTHKCLVDCPLGCGGKIDRCDSNVHYNSTCKNTIIECAAKKQTCPWKGPRGDLEKHLPECLYTKLKPELTNFIEELQRVTTDLNNKKEQNKQLAEQNKQLTEEKDQLSRQLEAIKKRI